MRDYQKGDEKAFNALFARHEGRLYNFFLRRLGDESVSADLYQKTWLKVHQGRDRYDPEKSFRTWFFTVAYNVLRDEFKRRASAREVRADEGVEAAGENFPDPVARAAERAQTRALIDRAMESLPDAQREILILSKYEGLGYRAIAQIMGLSVGAVKQKAYRGFATLRVKLAPQLGEGEA